MWVFSTVTTRATSVASPATGCDTKWKASFVHQMSAPPPTTVRVPSAYEALPSTPTAPTSWCVHGDGIVVDDGGPPAAFNPYTLMTPLKVAKYTLPAATVGETPFAN